ncbi:homocysteine methyltransferase [Streptomyces sp. Root431]|uniref:homocysteine S-methyltransferase n=1 Tax=Streptomyces sp. Root431 TaxID=1736535 RepID=UPI0006F9BD44|nr:homocysteine S-methyltransferase [Streptomyces sp. Root431]KQX12698.1 homocysteine methyltransferase [Streptomyces sp. Root431]
MKPVRTLTEALREGALVLDGGLSNQLEAQGCDLSDALWSARLLADGPEQIEAAHAAYVRAGARVVTTASYQATFEGFARRGLSRAETAGLLARSVELARAAAERAGEEAAQEARQEAGQEARQEAGEGVGHEVGEGAGQAVGREGGREAGEEVWVAASVGPYGAMLADGSEYRGRYGLSVRELERFHRPRVEVLAAAGPDVLALETVPDVDEAEALLRAVDGCGVPVWLSYTVEGGRTRAGQELAEAFAVAAGNDQVVAVGINCCDPAEAGAAVELAVAVTEKPAVVYPNSGERWDAGGRGWRGGLTFDPSGAAVWAGAGARLIGGCCRVGPSAIAAVARALPHGR